MLVSSRGQQHDGATSFSFLSPYFSKLFSMNHSFRGSSLEPPSEFNKYHFFYRQFLLGRLYPPASSVILGNILPVPGREPLVVYTQTHRHTPSSSHRVARCSIPKRAMSGLAGSWRSHGDDDGGGGIQPRQGGIIIVSAADALSSPTTDCWHWRRPRRRTKAGTAKMQPISNINFQYK